jgi:hypothetical protein
MKQNIINISGAGLLAMGLFLWYPCVGQSPDNGPGLNPTVIRMAANTEYNKAGKLKRVMLGDHYRKEWGTAVDVEILDMETFAGGLTPVKAGGGLQTKSLRLNGANGQQYVLRSVNKDPSKALVAELRGTFAEDVVQDQISSSNPFAPMVVASLAQAAGIFHSTPRLVYVPVTSKLGEFKKEFGGILCLIEERPSGNESNNSAFGYSKNVINSGKLFEKILFNTDYQVDEKAFLRARLFDMLIGDWDRHEDQWMWAGFKENDKTIYRPVPRDRDQAFASLDGVIPQLTTRKWAIRKVQDFDYQIDDVAGLNMNGRFLDMSFTTRLVLTDWLTIANELQAAITDRVIEEAFSQLPKEIFDISGKKTIAKLKTRRNKLDVYAKEYYMVLSKAVSIAGTRQKEVFEVTRVNNEMTSVLVYTEKGAINYYRTFKTAETKEIRLYGLEGNDVFKIHGDAKKGILVRVLGGKDLDSVSDLSYVNGLAHKTRVYDDAVNQIDGSAETRLHISSDSLTNGYNRKGHKYDLLAPVPSFGFNPDDGLYLGGGVIIKKQQFGKAPFGYMMTIGGNYAFQTGAYNFWYRGLFREAAGKWDLQLDATVNAPNWSRNYYGLGNETVKLEDKDLNYYRVRFDQVTIGAALRRQWGRKHTLLIGGDYQTVNLRRTEDRFISTHSSKLDSTDFARNHFGDAKIEYQFSTLNNQLYPTKGIRISSGAQFTQDLNENDKQFVKLFTEVALYKSFGKLTLASRSGVAANLGNDYEFYQANTLGNTTYLRGYRKDRFAGKTSVYQNSEIRYSIGNMNAYLFKAAWGVLAFADHGRVWMPNEDSDKWHHGYGGGLWLLPYNKLALTATYGVSKEDKVVSITAGFLF